ncbi:MAG: chemotaxis protein CheB [Pikeienuella sp.]
MPTEVVPSQRDALSEDQATDQMTPPETPGGEVENFVIGIGASAGGLEALMELVKNLPETIQATYVVVQHMSPAHKSLLTVLLARETHLEVKDVVDGVRPEANTVYVPPPNTDIVYRDGQLRLIKPSVNVAVPKPSVDRFFISIAEELGDRSVGVVLSGTGSDGSYGVQAIRGSGGVTIAQDDATAKYDGMPVSAMETGFVDLVLSPRQIGTHLAKILARPRDLEQFRAKAVSDDPLTDLLQIVLARTRVDFREYKKTTIHRRMERRMVALGIPKQEDYTRYCRANPEEIDALYKDFLISVTRFFRDKSEFEALKPYIQEIAETHSDQVVRIWIAGCATGEEAYSVAMLMAEALGPEALRNDRLQIFATDIDKKALAKARLGRYSLEAANHIPPELFEKYVEHVDDMIEISADLRNVILFSEHNLCQDPPFLNIDLICCRNLLIYFNNSLQAKVLGRLHYSLDKEGTLFLGIAETISVSDELFRNPSSDKKFYRKRVITRAEERARDNEMSGGIRVRPRNVPRGQSRIRDDKPDPGMFESLARAVGPNSILISDEMRIVRVFGDISPYVSLNEGMRLQLSATMLRPPLNQDARMLAGLALKQGTRREGVPKRLTPDATKTVRLDAYPLQNTKGVEPLVLLTFTEIEDAKKDLIAETESHEETSERVQALERDLSSARDTLQQTIEELETSNEELQALNEEMQSTNEELQATNEELETSNEELQSTNEELVTVNEELQVSSMELSSVSDEQDAILDNVAAALLIIDSALQVVKASSEAVKMFGMSCNFNRPHVSQINAPQNFPRLTDICLEVIQHGRPVARDITAPEGVFLLHCAPYSNNKGQILGATVIIARSSDTSELQSLMLKQSRQLMMQRNGEGTILRISEQSAKVLGAENAQMLVGQNLTDVLGDVALPVLREDRDFLQSGEDVRTTEHVLSFPNGMRRCLRMERYRYVNAPDRPETVYSIAVDVTDIRTAERELRAHNEQLTMISDIAKIGYWMIDLEGNEITWSDEVYAIHGLSRDEFTPDLGAGLSFYHPDDRSRVTQHVEAAMTDGEPFEFSARIVRPDGVIVPVHSLCRIIADTSGEPMHIVGVFSKL